MARPVKYVALVAFVGLLAACEENSNLENAGIGAAAGAGVAAVAGTSVVTGAAVGAAAGAVSNELR